MRPDLDRIVRLLRTGQSAYGALAWTAFDRTHGALQPVQALRGYVNSAMNARDYLKAADLVEHCLAPLLA